MSIVEDYLSRQPTSRRKNLICETGKEHWELYRLAEKMPDHIHEERSWVSLAEIHNGKTKLRLPFGSRGFMDFDELSRWSGYVPILCFKAAAEEMAYGRDVIFKLAVHNENVVWKSRRYKDSTGHIFVNSVYYRAHLALPQRIALVAIGVGMIFRAIINCCQIGIIFLPLDILFSYVFPWNSDTSHCVEVNKRLPEKGCTNI